MKKLLPILLSIVLVLSLALTMVACGDGGEGNSGDGNASDGGNADRGGNDDQGGNADQGGNNDQGGSNDQGENGNTDGGNPPDDSGNEDSGGIPDGENPDDSAGDNNENADDSTGESNGSDNTGDSTGESNGSDNTGDSSGDEGDNEDGSEDGGSGENDLPQLPLPDGSDDSTEGDDAQGGDGAVDLPVIPIPNPGNNSALNSYNLLMNSKSPATATVSTERASDEGGTGSLEESCVISYSSDGSAAVSYSFTVYDGAGNITLSDEGSASVSADGELVCDADSEGLVKRLVYIADTASFDFTLCESYTESDSVVSMSFLAASGTEAMGAEMATDFTVHLVKDCSLFVLTYNESGSVYSTTVTYS